MKRWLIGGGVLLALFAAAVAVAALLPEQPASLPGSITNSRPAGVRALGEVLARNGVDVRQVTNLDEAAAAPAGSTLAVYFNQPLSETALGRLRNVPADLVVLYAGDVASGLETLTSGRIDSAYWWSDQDHPSAECDDADATAAGTLTSATLGLHTLNAAVTTCFPAEDDTALYADTTIDGHRVTVIAGNEWLRNDTITHEGNAALALRSLGRHAQLTWYLPGADARPGPDAENTTFDVWSLLPPWAPTTFAVLLVAGFAAALWRGRRFGALVAEPLPVAVPAAEVSSGLARLYRQANARGHAAAGLRAASVHRMATRIGLPRNASADLVVQRLSQATGEAPERVRQLYYGPNPDNDTALVELAGALNDLEGRLTRRD